MIVRGGPSLRFEGRVLARLPSKETVLLATQMDLNALEAEDPIG